MVMMMRTTARSYNDDHLRYTNLDRAVLEVLYSCLVFTLADVLSFHRTHHVKKKAVIGGSIRSTVQFILHFSDLGGSDVIGLNTKQEFKRIFSGFNPP